MPDRNGDRKADAVVIRRNVPEGSAVIEDLLAPPRESRLAAFTFTPGRTAVDARPVDNADGLGKRAIALLASGADGTPIVEVRSWRGKLLRTIPFNRGHEAIALDILPDQNGNQSDEALVLARQTAFDRPRLLIRDLATKEKVNNISLPKLFNAVDVVAAPDVNGDGTPEAVVLATRKSSGLGVVLVWDTGGSGKIVHIALRFSQMPLLGQAYRRVAGADTVTVLSGTRRRVSYNIATGDFGGATSLSSRYEAVAITAALVRTPGGYRWDQAFLVRRPETDRAYVVGVGEIAFPDGSIPLAFSFVPDLNKSRWSEIAVLWRDRMDGSVFLSVRDTKYFGADAHAVITDIQIE